jgi:hypothetical protein
MRKVTAGLFISLDGVVEAPDQWRFPYFNDEMGAAVDATLGVADTSLLGRKTYDSFAGAWPEREAVGGEDAHFAKVLGDARKIVVSNQQLQFTWRNSEQRSPRPDVSSAKPSTCSPTWARTRSPSSRNRPRRPWSPDDGTGGRGAGTPPSRWGYHRGQLPARACQTAPPPGPPAPRTAQSD